MISDFRWALGAIALLVVIAIIIFNRIQEKRYRERAEKAFSAQHPDVLFEALEATRPVRLEPSLGVLPVAPGTVILDSVAAPDALAPKSTAAGIDPNIDCVGLVLADAPIAPGWLTPFMTRAKRIGKPVLWEGLTEGHWQAMAENQTYGSAGAEVRELRVALQLADRRGAATREEIQYFLDLVNEVAASVSAVSQRVPLDDTVARARELDTFCADSDIEIAINIVGKGGVTFAPSKVRDLAEAAGMTLFGDDVYVFCDDNDDVLFTLRNMDGAPANRPVAYFAGLTLALDVPRVEQGVIVFERMFALANQLARELGGEVVDDNRKSLTAPAVSVIKKTLGDIAAAMEARGIAPGSPTAKRLFF